MTYLNIHNSIINKAIFQNRIKGKKIYYEKHHILPKCMNGTNEKSNLVLLTAKEHFLIHKLLIKIYPHIKPLAAAFWRMCNSNRTKVSSSDYEEGRLNHSLFMKSLNGKLHSQEHKDKIGDLKRNRIVSEETKDKLRLSRLNQESPNKGKTFSKEWKSNLSKSKLGKIGKKGAKHSLEIKEANKQRALDTPRDNYCIYCKKYFKIQAFSQWHGEKCKHKGD